MGRSKNIEVKVKIVGAAETLFAARGYDGTSMEDIAGRAGINKALIYYYFKSKDAIKDEIFDKFLSDTQEMVNQTFDVMEEKSEEEAAKKQMARLVKFIVDHKEIVRILFTESLKEDEKKNPLLAYADVLINHEVQGIKKKMEGHRPEITLDHQYLMVFEFFTGFIPLAAFVIFKDKWQNYFHCNGEKLIDDFLTAFEKTHLADHFSKKK